MLHLTSSGRFAGKIKTGERVSPLTCDNILWDKQTFRLLRRTVPYFSSVS